MGRWFFSDVILTLEKMFCDDPERGWWSWQMPQINHKGYLGRSRLQKLSGCWHYAQGLNHVTMMKHLQLTLSWQRLPSAKCLLAQVRISPDSNSPLGMTTKGKLLILTSENSSHLASSTLRNGDFKQSQNKVIGQASLSLCFHQGEVSPAVLWGRGTTDILNQALWPTDDLSHGNH